MKPDDVSDHAVLRYLERVCGFDIDAIRRRCAELCAPAVAAGATSVQIDGHLYILAGGRLVTVRPTGPHHGRRRRLPRHGPLPPPDFRKQLQDDET